MKLRAGSNWLSCDLSLTLNDINACSPHLGLGIRGGLGLSVYRYNLEK